MDDLVLQHQYEDGIVVIEMNRAQAANALSIALLEALLSHLAELRNRDARVVILTAAGTKAFCAGADLKERRGMDEGQVRQAVERIRRTVEAIAALPMPVIAALNGAAYGGGTELALAADLRIFADTAMAGLTETSLAIIPGAGGTQRLMRLIGLAKAKELIYTARRIDAHTALELGLANAVVPLVELMPAALQLAREIAANGPIAVRQAKFAMDAGLGVDLQTALRIEQSAYEGVISTADRVEALNAFAEKRAPRFCGR